MKRLIIAIALLMPLTTFCQSSPFDHSQLFPVTVGQETWYAMPKDRLARIANRLDSFERLTLLIHPIDSALTLCRSLSEDLQLQVYDFTQLVGYYEQEIQNKDLEIFELNQTIERANETLDLFDSKIIKERKIKKRWQVASGVGFAGMALAVLAAIVF